MATKKTAPQKAPSPEKITSDAKAPESSSAAGQLLPPDYDPRKDDTFMSPLMREFFRQRLLNWREDLLQDSTDTLHHLQEETHNLPDANDRASTETDMSLELRTRDRQRKLLNKIEEALQRIEDGSYGYCSETDEPISVPRLEARPIATLSIEDQEAHERAERIHRDFD